MGPLEPALVDAYLRRLSAEREAPSAEVLTLLHRRHVETIPYETLWIHGGEMWDSQARAAAQRIAFEHRGGYCYHLNGAFALLLQSLGYRVDLHAGGVHGPGGPSAAEAGNHLVLTVHGLIADDNPAGDWYVDVGLGDAVYEPIVLRAAQVPQGPFRLELQRTTGSPFGDWHLLHDPGGGFTGMSWHTGPPDPVQLAAQHQWLSTSPESGFVKIGLAQTRDATGVNVIRGLVLKRIGSDASTGVLLDDRRSWFTALADLFGLTFEASEPGMQDRLWQRTVAAHEAWQASQS